MFRPKRLLPENPAGSEPMRMFNRNAWLIILFSALLATFLLPRQTPFPYRYETGQPWGYRTLKAPFDFEVLRPESAVREQLEAVRAEQLLYLRLSPEVAREQKRLFSEALDNRIRISRNDAQYEELLRNQGAYRSYGLEMLEHLYSAGILPEGDPLIGRQSTATTVVVVTGQSAVQKKLGDLRTPGQARDFLIDTLPYSTLRQPEVLLPLLETLIAPNTTYDDSLTLAGKQRRIAEVISTGITVRKGEIIVNSNELVHADTYQKLESLAGHYDMPPGLQLLAGYFLAAFLAFGGFWLYWSQLEPLETPSREKRLFLSVLMLVLLTLLSFANWIGGAVTLLLPLYILPWALRSHYPPRIGFAAWLLVVLLNALALDWGGGWVLIQFAGLAGAWYFWQEEQAWNTRLAAGILIAIGQTMAWAAAGLAGKLPDLVWNYDTPIFIAAAAVLSLTVFPLRSLLEKSPL